MEDYRKCCSPAGGGEAVLRTVGAGERDRFNHYIKNHPHGCVLQSYEWGELKKRYGWSPARLVLEREGEIAGAVTLLLKEKGFCPMAYSPRGPVVDISQGDSFRLFLHALRDYLKSRGVAFWKMDPEVDACKSAREAFKGSFTPSSTHDGFGGIQPRAVWRLDVSRGSYPENCLGKSARRQIKKAQKEGIKIRQGCREDLPAFYRVLKETAARNRFRLRLPAYYEDMWDLLHGPGHLYLALAHREGRILCGALAAPFGRGVWDLYAGTSEEARKTGASYLLTWDMIQRAAHQGHSFYDLGGIPLKEDGQGPLQGLYRFKSRFGGERREFVGEYDLILSPFKHRLWHLGMGARERLLKNLQS